MLTLHIEAENGAELMQKTCVALGIVIGGAQAPVAEVAPLAPAPTPLKRGPKAKTPEAPPAPEPIVETPSPFEVEEVTVEAMSEKLRELSAKKGLPAVTAILAKHGAQRVKEVKAELRSVVLAEATAALT